MQCLTFPCESAAGEGVRDPPSVAVFPDPLHPPAVKNEVCPLKTALIQIKLNEVSAANPCVFQQLKQPPHTPSSLTNEWVKPAASGPPLDWPCSQAARLPLADGDDSRRRSDFLPH